MGQDGRGRQERGGKGRGARPVCLLVLRGGKGREGEEEREGWKGKGGERKGRRKGKGEKGREEGTGREGKGT